MIAPSIDSDDDELYSVQKLFEEIKDRYPGYASALLHGRLPAEEKADVMRRFKEGSIQILVSTIVIEVGIDVPEATVMIIENSERFGLAQMHQLRGRVGRGDAQSYCCLVMGNESEVASKRMEIMVHSGDGFRIAEEDLRLRGPGEIFGTRQHGLPEMHIGDIVRHGDVLEKAKQAAVDILSEDAALQGADFAELRRRVERMFGEDIKLEL